ncbi:MAG: hypothetical protein ABI662_02205 [Dermatophilaceae bacterium]
MSQMTSAARAGARPLHRPATAIPRLRVVTGATPRHGAAFSIICAMLLAAGLIALLLLNTALAQGSFVLHDLRATSGRLVDTQDALTQSLEASQSPASLAAKAVKMGMVPSESAAFLRLSDGRVIGVAKPARPAPGFIVVRTAASSPVVAPAVAKTAGTAARPSSR